MLLPNGFHYKRTIVFPIYKKALTSVGCASVQFYLELLTAINIKLGKYLAVLPMLSLWVACAQLGQLETQDTDSRKLGQNARTHSDHNNLSNYYDNLAKEMAGKAAEKWSA